MNEINNNLEETLEDKCNQIWDNLDEDVKIEVLENAGWKIE